ncbi:MAG: hypothetical protein E7001_08495 [Coriobacteriaceae bacterium]|nr:hypothetical protein [Coriobacteriaceae bacterium]
MIRRKLINFSDVSCDYRVGAGALDEFGPMAKSVVGTPKRAVIVCAEESADGPALAVSRALIDAGFQVSDLSIPAGEDAASIAYAARLFEVLAATGATADDLIVAVGGAGLCGLTQFCGRAWCGGTATVLVPTALDGMVTVATSMEGLSVGDDASMVWGASRPAMVVADLDLVSVAPEKERRLGYLALLTSALIDCRRSWDRLGERIELIRSVDEAALVDVLAQAQTGRLMAEKSVSPSARAGRLFGTVTARALRSCLGPKVPWWALLAEGMRFESRLGVEAGRFDAEDMFELDDRLEAFGIDELPFELEPALFIAAIREACFKRSNRFLLPLPQMVGSVRLSVVDDELLARHAEAYLASRAEIMDADA